MAKLITKFVDLYRKEGNQNLSEVAKSIGVSRATLYSLLYDNWKQIQRGTIEKLCDYYKCSITDLFKIADDPFWLPFIQKGDFFFIFGGTRVEERKSVIGFWDIRVVNEMVTYLNRLGGKNKINFNFISSLEFENNVDGVINFVKKNNSILIGSPKVNRITEILLAKLFDADPFNSDKKNRERIPYRFIRPSEWGVSKTESAVTETNSNNNELGIFSQKEKRIVAVSEWYDDFYNRRIQSGRDCALIVVVNKPFEATANVKLIILAGYSGLSSYGAAQMMIRESKKLEPPTRKPLIKVIQFEYKKMEVDKDDRQITKMSFVTEK